MGRIVTLLGTITLASVFALVSCGGPAKEGGQGAECFRAEECAEGLVCIDKACTNNLTSVNFPSDAAVTTADAGASPVN